MVGNCEICETIQDLNEEKFESTFVCLCQDCSNKIANEDGPSLDKLQKILAG